MTVPRMVGGKILTLGIRVEIRRGTIGDSLVRVLVVINRRFMFADFSYIPPKPPKITPGALLLQTARGYPQINPKSLQTSMRKSMPKMH